MKKFILSLVILLVSVAGVCAMTYQQAREQAFFLTDKMAYELNLSEQQYEAAYQINLDYLMSVNTVDDVYALSWRQRNVDMRHVLLDWQYSTFCAASYFFRPLYWNAGHWHFGVYAHYPRHDFFYFSRPLCYAHYRGGHSWRDNGGASWYGGRVHDFRPNRPHVGMRDNYHRGGNRYETGRHHDGSSFRTGRPATPNRVDRVPQNHATPSRVDRVPRNNATPPRHEGNGAPQHNGRPNYSRESSTRHTVGTTAAAPYGGGSGRGHAGTRSFTPSTGQTRGDASRPAATNGAARGGRR